MKFIDSHLHLFDRSLGQYQWLKSENPPHWADKHLIARDFSEQDLNVVDQNLAGIVHIEAGFDNLQPWREIDWLEQTVKLPLRTVAGINLTLPSDLFKQQIEALKHYSSVVGVRHILDDDADILLANEDVQHNLSVLAQSSFHFELQMPLSNTSAVNKITALLSEFPKFNIIVNHCGSPGNEPLLNANLSQNPWLAGLQALGQFDNCAMKCSGWEMVDREYDISVLKALTTSVIDAFGEDKVMLASNFPLTLFSTSYQGLWQQYQQLFAHNQSLLTKLTFENSLHWYRF